MKIKIKYLEENKGTDIIKNKNYIGIYILGIRVKKIHTDRDIKAKNNSNKYIEEAYMLLKQTIATLKKEEILDIVQDLLKSIKIQKLDLNLGLNLDDPIANAYSIALINSILPLVFTYNNKINLDNISYNTFISNKMLYLQVRSILYISLFKNLKSIFKLVFKIYEDKSKNK